MAPRAGHLERGQVSEGKGPGVRQGPGRRLLWKTKQGVWDPGTLGEESTAGLLWESRAEDLAAWAAGSAGASGCLRRGQQAEGGHAQDSGGREGRRNELGLEGLPRPIFGG